MDFVVIPNTSGLLEALDVGAWKLVGFAKTFCADDITTPNGLEAGVCDGCADVANGL